LTAPTLIHSLKKLRGNARGCVLTEPLWGIPFYLYAPYASIYMLAFGLTDSELGLLASIGTALQVITTLLSGAVTDKLGRKRTTLIFDLLSWSIPALLLAFAQNFTYFLLATVINSVWRIVHTSWSCLLVEDTDPELLVDVFAWITIAGLVAALVTPVTGALIARFGLVPTIRGVYILAAVMMASKALATNAMVTETRQGLIRMRETAHQSLFAVLRELPEVARHIVRRPVTIYTGLLMTLMSIYWVIQKTFWSVVVVETLEIPAERLAFYTMVRSITMMVVFFFLMPRLQSLARRSPTGDHLLFVGGSLIFGLSQLLLVLTPAGATWFLILVTVLEGVGLPLTRTVLDKLTVTTVDAAERARISALLSVMMLLVTSPFGWIAGRLSTLDRRYPFVLAVGIFAVSAGLGVLGAHAAHRERERQTATV